MWNIALEYIPVVLSSFGRHIFASQLVLSFKVASIEIVED